MPRHCTWPVETCKNNTNSKVVNIESDLRPIAVTNSLAKTAEKFVSCHFNEYFDEFTDDNQFGSVRNRSTKHALLKIMHELFLASDSSQNIKAFDVTDHNVLFNKFDNCGMPEHVVAWSLDFLCGRKQFSRFCIERFLCYRRNSTRHCFRTKWFQAYN